MMRLLGLLVVLLIAVAAVGYYLDWFKLSTADSSGKTNISVTIDKEKIREDEERAKAKVQDLGQRAKEQAKQPGNSKEENR
jgi:hypothetical protein